MSQPPQLPPNVAVFQIAASVMPARALWAAAELGVADLLGDDPVPADRLAESVGADADALYRVLRLLASFGIFRELDGRRFAQTPMSATLRSDHPTRTRAAVLMVAGPMFWKTLDEFMHSVKTGDTAWRQAFGRPLFDYLGEHPQDAAIFNDAMIGIHGGEPPAVAEAYDFAGVGTLVDVGGGTGNMLIHVLKRHPSVRGVLYDLSHVAEAAKARLAQEELAGRCRVESGSFFETVPAGADAYILSHIIHDWDEAGCVKILENCRRAMNPDGRVLLVEMVITAPNDAHPSKLLDLVMLTIPGGRERTPEEYSALFEKAGLRLGRIVPTASPVSVIEAWRA